MREVTGDERENIIAIAFESRDFNTLTNHFEEGGGEVLSDDPDVIHIEDRYLVTVPFDDGDPETDCEIVITVHDGGVIGTNASVDEMEDDTILRHQWYEVDERGRVHSGSVAGDI